MRWTWRDVFCVCCLGECLFEGLELASTNRGNEAPLVVMWLLMSLPVVGYLSMSALLHGHQSDPSL